MKIRSIPVLLLTLACLPGLSQAGYRAMSRQQLRDKIMGGWAGQTIGVTFGGPYEFHFQGTFISDYQSLRWYDGYLKQTMINDPGLYDDLYMDLTFVDVFEKYGLDAPVDSFASAFAHAEYPLWHANQSARYNILQGIRAPQSGYWKNNPHADCIDYQIESDFAGLMSPGMPNTASAISDRIGHIMNYGDGWYGGVFVGAMYALAFTTSDLHAIITGALRAIPRESQFHQCIQDVINWHAQYPADWKQTWFQVQKKWAQDIGCPDGVFEPFDIDAKVNAAYVVIGLLYGRGDFTRTLEITTRCGQDADCNPSTAGGILGTLLGYRQIPAYWRMGLEEAETIDFKYTSMSLRKVYEIGFRHALQNIERHGGSVGPDSVRIRLQEPHPVRFEASFGGLYPLEKIQPIVSADGSEVRFRFTGTGFVIRGDASGWNNRDSASVYAELWVDDHLVEKPVLPISYLARRNELAWHYDLADGEHQVVLRFLNTSDKRRVQVGDVLLYGKRPRPAPSGEAGRPVR
ncbi:MAG TPA: ADP-ribosylglycohydrolase family protein [Chitinophagaceae bacterium]|nr:ADP-ribosylglycohydrolase family protein [Chitinophagaceae bacterium]